MTRQMKKFLCDEAAVTAIEYGLIAGLISIVIIVPAMNKLGPMLSSVFITISAAL